LAFFFFAKTKVERFVIFLYNASSSNETYMNIRTMLTEHNEMYMMCVVSLHFS
jgi:hypothetical protein